MSVVTGALKVCALIVLGWLVLLMAWGACSTVVQQAATFGQGGGP